ncbi:NAD(P)/FAD-dependent oxidoreductase [candidate division KSB1 bacterium]
MFRNSDKSQLDKAFNLPFEESNSNLKLNDGSKVAVIGGGPAGSFMSYFLLNMSDSYGIDIDVDIFDPQDFSRNGSPGCNHCGGIISESLVRIMAADGINLPGAIIQTGIESYMLHMDEGNVKIDTPLHEKRIAAVYRGIGPRGIKEIRWSNSFDKYLQLLAFNTGAEIIRDRVERIDWNNDFPEVIAKRGSYGKYDLIVGAVGVNTSALKLFENLDIGYKKPETTKTYICELPLDKEQTQQYLGNSMHLFLLNIPRLEFAALIPKGDFVTVVLLGDEIDRDLVRSFLESDEVRGCLPPGYIVPDKICHCGPRICTTGAVRPFTDRLVMIGDCGVSRLYKDGIGAAYRTAKTAAAAAVFKGISAKDFQDQYMPVYKSIANDNKYGKLVFGFTEMIQKTGFAKKTILRIVRNEQKNDKVPQRLSSVLWDTFTGSAPYKDVFMRFLHPAFIARFLWNLMITILPINGRQEKVKKGEDFEYERIRQDIQP